MSFIVVIALAALAPHAEPPRPDAVTAEPARCLGVMDTSEGCPPLAAVAPEVRADAAPIAAGSVSSDETTALPGSVALLGLGLGAAGAAALGAALTVWSEAPIRETARVGGAALLVGAGLVGAGAASLWLFDPSTGRLRLDMGRRE